VFLLVTVTCCRSRCSRQAAGAGSPVTVTVLVALLVCLIPTTIGGLLSAIGVAGMSRMMQANVIATSGRAVPATWTCCCWTRPAPSPWATARPRLLPAPAWRAQLADAASWPRWPMKRRKAAASWCWPRAFSPASARWPAWAPVRALHGADP
jgi:K+-transporting ATPase ATPase B chain